MHAALCGILRQKGASMINKDRIEEFFGEFVYGAIDGTVTTFAVVAASAGAGLDAVIIIILGIANLVGDGFSMGASAYLSAQSERDLKIRRHIESGEEGQPQHSPDHGETPLSDGLVTFGSFVVVGLVPLMIYIADVTLGLKLASETLFVISAGMTGLTFIMVGWLKASITKTSHFRSTAETLILGSVAAILAYLLGDILGKALGAA